MIAAGETVNYAMNKFMRLSLLTKRLSSFLRATVMRHLARDSLAVQSKVISAKP